MRKLLAMCLVLVWACLPASHTLGQDAGEDNLVTVEVTGVGMSEAEAVNDALRKAVEEGAGTFIYSHSETEDFALVRDTVLARSAGFVQSKEVLSSVEQIDGSWEVRVRAVVSVRGIEDTWGVVQNLLTQMGRPKIMVAITEEIDGDVQADSTVQTRIEALLLESGFTLVNRDQLEAIDQRNIAAAVAANNPAAIQAIAQRYGAQLFITGSTSAALGERTMAYGAVQINRYGADGDIKCYRSDTAELLSSRNGRIQAVDEVARLAAKKALSLLGEALGPVIQQDILYFWQDALQGRGGAQLIVQGLSFTDAMDVEEALSAIEEIESVNMQFNATIAEFELTSAIPAKSLARILARQLADMLEITSTSQNVIKANFRQ